MSDMEEENDLSRYAQEEEKVKPIDLDLGEFAKKKKPKEPDPMEGKIGAKHKDDMSKSDVLFDSPEQQREREEKERLEKERAEQIEKAFEHDTNYIKKGEYMDILEKIPHLRRIMIGAGWQKRLVEGEYLDVDISIFLLDRNNQTRVDEDFVFYNNDKACEGAVHHYGDSRAGAGDGDDESIFVDLNGLPFDIMKIVFVYSLYDPEIKGHHFGMIRKIHFRLYNKDDGHEVVRYLIADDDHKGGNVFIAGALIREGPKWIFEAQAQTLNGGLARVATDYGIIVKELQGTGENTVGEGESF